MRTQLILLRPTLHLSLLGLASVIRRVMVTNQTITRRAGTPAVLSEISAGTGLEAWNRL